MSPYRDAFGVPGYEEVGMADSKKKADDYATVANAVVAKLPKALRDTIEVVEGGGAYTLVKHGGRTVASVRAKNVRVTILHDGSADSVARIASTIEAAAKTKPLTEVAPKTA